MTEISAWNCHKVFFSDFGELLETLNLINNKPFFINNLNEIL